MVLGVGKVAALTLGRREAEDEPFASRCRRKTIASRMAPARRTYDAIN